MSLIWKLLRSHISIGQLVGFFIASLIGFTIILTSIQFYNDASPLFSGENSLIKNEYLVISKKVSALSGMIGKSNTFNEEEIKKLRKQAFATKVGQFTPSLFKVTAGIGSRTSGVNFSTDMFFESIPDEFLDINAQNWNKSLSDSNPIPIIIPRNYLNLYNFGFAQSQNLPQLTEGVLGLVKLDIGIRGINNEAYYKGNIVGFTNQFNTILVPESFLKEANMAFAPNQTKAPSRLIIEVKDLSDPAIVQYFDQNGYETEGNNTDSGKMRYFLQLITSIVAGIGVIIALLAFYILILSIFLLLQKNNVKLSNLLLLGYSSNQLALPYQLITLGLNIIIFATSISIVMIIKSLYGNVLNTISSNFQSSSLLMTIIIGIIMTLAITAIDWIILTHKIKSLNKIKGE